MTTPPTIAVIFLRIPETAARNLPQWPYPRNASNSMAAAHSPYGNARAPGARRKDEPVYFPVRCATLGMTSFASSCIESRQASGFSL